MRSAGRVSLVSLMGLSACAVSGAGPIVEPGAAFDTASVSVEGRAFVARFTPGTLGTVLTGGGALQIAGTSVQVTAADLRQDEGMIAKEAALAACTQAGGAFQPQAIGRYPAAGTWVFDGACA